MTSPFTTSQTKDQLHLKSQLESIVMINSVQMYSIITASIAPRPHNCERKILLLDPS